MSDKMSKDIVTIRNWLNKEAYLPQNIEDFVLRKFLHSCYGSLERTKQCIERFCSTRANMPEVYSSRDPLSPALKKAFKITWVSTFEADGTELLIHQLDDPGLDSMVFYDLLKSFAVQADYWIRHHPVLPEGHTIIMDIKDYTLKIITKINVMYFRDFIMFLLEGMPVRVKHVHIINCPSYYDKLYALVKPVLPAEICNIIQFHTNIEGLHKVIDKKYLPTELGGSAGSMKQQHEDWVARIEADRKWFLDDNQWKADLKMKPKNQAQQNMNGSFRMLSID